MPESPKIGLVPSIANWFRDVGVAQPVIAGKYAGLLRQMQQNLEGIKTVLGEKAGVVATELVCEPSQVEEAAAVLKRADPDLLVFCLLMWTEDLPLLRLAEIFPDLPIVLWCHYPEEPASEHLDMAELFARSACVGAFQISGSLQRLRPATALVVGNHREPQAVEAIAAFACAAWTRRQLRKARFLQVPWPYPGMSDLALELEALERALGCSVARRPMADFLRLAEEVTAEEIHSYRNWLEQFPRREVTDEQLQRACCASLALVKAAEEWQVEGLALDDLHADLHANLGARPCLTVPQFFARGRVFGMEGDIAQVIASYAFRLLTGQPVMFIEIFSTDIARNTLIVGHAGMHDLSAADMDTVTLTPDYEYEGLPKCGAWMEFSVKSGPATLAQFVMEHPPRLLLVEGEVLPVGKKVEGFPSAEMRISTPVRQFMEWAFAAHTTHHWVLIPGRHAGALRALGKIMGMTTLECTGGTP